MSKLIKQALSIFMTMFLFFSVLPLNAQQARALFDPEVEKVEVDVVYKYIDLTDPTLHRDGIPQIKKDYDNNELMYSLRSVLKNIPWVRKIFIIMPNDKVRFLKEPQEIKDKIVYVKDKDILGFDSSSCETFIWTLWKLKNYGCSDNILFFNDDYFIGKPLNKSDFFYRDENKNIIPYIFYNSPIVYTSKKEMSDLHVQLNKSTGLSDEQKQNGQLYKTQNACTYNFLYTVLDRDYLHVPKYVGSTVHNAVGYNLGEVKQLYDIVNTKYEYADISLRGRLGRSKVGVLMGSFYSFYYLNKENRKINKNISYRCFNTEVPDKISDLDLFCINTGGDREYNTLENIRSKMKMEMFFPETTQFERKDYDDWSGVDLRLKEQAKSELSNSGIKPEYSSNKLTVSKPNGKHVSKRFVLKKI